MGEKAEPKISLPEAVFIGIFLGVLDLIDLIPFAGDITDVFAAPLLLYYVMKHINGIAYAASLILDAIPFTQEFPTRSLVWWGTVIFDHVAPKQLSSAVEQIGELEEGGMGEEAGAAEGTINGVERSENAFEEEEGINKTGNRGGSEVRAEGEAAEDEKKPEEKKETGNEIELGSEVSPEEEAEAQDFGRGMEENGGEEDEDPEDELAA